MTDYTYPDGTPVTRGYSLRGELATIGYDGTTVDTRTYDDGGRMLTSSYNNGVSETRAYNNDNTLASISFTGAPIGDLSYTWDENKNKTSESITGVMSGYGFSIPTNGYDAEDRLVGYQRNDNNLNQSWNLSLVGDWNSVTTSGVGFQPATQSRTHGPTHEILTAGSDSITHDAKGNITAKPSNLDPAFTSTLQWDFDNRLMSMDVNEDSTADATFKYDALGRRVQKNSTVYALTGQQVIAEYSAGTAASAPTEQYVFATYIDEPVLKDGTGGLVYYHRNQQYSILALTSSSGVMERYSYDAYGKITVKEGSGSAITNSTLGNSITYTGRNFDSETGDYYYRARYYDPGLGRFCSRDPIGYWDGCSLFYPYFAINGLDPSGLIEITYDVYDMAIQEGHTFQTIIAEVDVWVKTKPSCTINPCDGECTGSVAVDVGFKWRGKFVSAENLGEDRGYLCDDNGHCEKLGVNDDKNGRNGTRSLSSVSCKGGTLQGSLWINGFSGSPERLQEMIDDGCWALIHNSISIFEIKFKIKVEECGSIDESIELRVGPAAWMWEHERSPRILPHGTPFIPPLAIPRNR